MTENKGDLISREALKEHKFVGIKYVQIGGRTNGKTLESINKAYQQGWNDCIDAIIDNAPTVEERPQGEITEEDIQNAIKAGYENGYSMAQAKYQRPQGEWIKWNFKTFGAMGDWEYKCSKCEKVYGGEYNFCPNCGADMKGGAE